MMHSLIRDSILAHKPGKVLEIGCGKDQALRPWFEELGHVYAGIDPQLGLYAEDLDCACEFDVIIAMATMQHIPGARTVLEKIWRSLKPGGIFVGTWTQCHGETGEGTYALLTAHGLKWWLQMAGFHNIEVEAEWPLWKSVPDLLFQGRQYAKPWQRGLEITLRGFEGSYRFARQVGHAFGAPDLNIEQRELATAGALAFAGRKK